MVGVSQRLVSVRSVGPLPSTSKDGTTAKSFDERIDSNFLERIRSSIEHVTIKEPESVNESDESEDRTFVTHSGDVTSPSNAPKSLESPMNFQSGDYYRIGRNVQRRLAEKKTAAGSIPSNLGKKFIIFV